jgi:hypothetical protein
MSDTKLTIRLTTEQQKQVFEATGKSCTEVTFDHIQSGQLNEEDMSKVVAGGVFRFTNTRVNASTTTGTVVAGTQQISAS